MKEVSGHTMYQADKRIISHHKRHVVLGWFAFIVLLIVAGSVIFVKFFLGANTTISAPPAPVVSKVTGSDGKDKIFDEGFFTIALPVDWKLASHQTEVYNLYTWHNT